MTKNISIYGRLCLKAIDSLSNQRSKDIISLRYGLKDGEGKTLEAIGGQYGITRERVRQIEDSILEDLRERFVNGPLKPALRNIDRYLNRQGGLAREERILTELTGIDSPHPERGAVFFMLNLGKGYQRIPGSGKFYTLWINSSDVCEKKASFINMFVKELKKAKRTFSLSEAEYFFKSEGYQFKKEELFSFLDAAKEIGQNNFGYFGLAAWPEINPRGAKDKAYIVFKDQSRPLHFKEVADLINKASLGNHPAQAQTVHNELIKDGRFVLVGRGIYALKEWGYQPGTVKDVIAGVLKEKGPSFKEDILNNVMERRLVKPNTVLINLQNRRYFTRDYQGKYYLAK